MKVLHTADWHLGQKLYEKERYEEHQAFLDWLLQTIEAEKVDLLLLSGDVFDTPNPPNKAMELYYNFLAQLLHSHCQAAVIVGGNHDSPFSLDAPKDLLKFMKLHIIGGTTENIADELIEIKDEKGAVVAVVAAIPFLRDRDIEYDKNNNSISQREAQIVQSIGTHYKKLADLITERNYADQIPLLATGHLFAQGGSANSEDNNEDEDAERKIYMGSLGIVPPSAFTEVFDYVALGHLHRFQQVGGKSIYYSGSPIPLSFSERKDEKIVVIIDFEKKLLKNLQIVPVPTHLHKTLKRFEGTLTEVCEAIAAFEVSTPTWAEVLLHLEQPTPNAYEVVQQAAQQNSSDFTVLRIKIESIQQQNMTWATMLQQSQRLQDLSAKDVFEQLCLEKGYTAEHFQNLMPLFDE
ncbi:MAG: exonuclease SbcCD subunit D C-terminal domain-containing protein, partial [Thermoflexibacteraceae bacterium]